MCIPFLQNATCTDGCAAADATRPVTNHRKCSNLEIYALFEVIFFLSIVALSGYSVVTLSGADLGFSKMEVVAGASGGGGGQTVQELACVQRVSMGLTPEEYSLIWL